MTSLADKASEYSDSGCMILLAILAAIALGLLINNARGSK